MWISYEKYILFLKVYNKIFIIYIILILKYYTNYHFIILILIKTNEI